MVGQEFLERQALPYDAVQGEGANVHALASAERCGYRLHRDRMERSARPVPEGVEDPRASAVDTGAAFGVWRTRLIARIVGLRRVLRGAVPSAPGVGLTRHPQTGAAEQPRLLYGNLLKIQWLAASQLNKAPRGNFWFPYGNLLILWDEFDALPANQIHQHKSH